MGVFFCGFGGFGDKIKEIRALRGQRGDELFKKSGGEPYFIPNDSAIFLTHQYLQRFVNCVCVVPVPDHLFFHSLMKKRKKAQ